MAQKKLSDNPVEMEPPIPDDRDGHLASLGLDLIRRAAPKGPIRLGFPADAADSYFPNLFPAGAG